MGEHHHLQALLGGMGRQVGVDFHHAPLEILPRPPHRQGGPSVCVPFREETGKMFFVPGQKKVRQLVVVHRVGVGRIGDPEVGGVGD